VPPLLAVAVVGLTPVATGDAPPAPVSVGAAVAEIVGAAAAVLVSAVFVASVAGTLLYPATITAVITMHTPRNTHAPMM